MVEARPEGVHFDHLAQLETIFDVLPLDTLDAQRSECARHFGIVRYDNGAHALLAPFLAHQIVGVRSVGWILGDTGNDHHSLAPVVAHLNGWIGFVLLRGIDARDGACTAALALVPEAYGTFGWLLDNANARFPVAQQIGRR